MSQQAKPLKSLEKELESLIEERTKVYRSVQDFKVDAETTRKAESQLAFLTKQINECKNKINKLKAPTTEQLLAAKQAWLNS